MKAIYYNFNWLFIKCLLGEICSDRWKYHGCRQKKPEGTSPAMFDTIARCCKFKRCTLTRFDVTRVTQGNVLGFSWEHVFGTAQKPWLWTEKPEGTSSARFGVRTAAKCGELKRCPDRVRSRTDNKDEVLEGKFVTGTLRLPQKTNVISSNSKNLA